MTPPDSSTPKNVTPVSGVVVPQPLKWHQKLAAWLVVVLAKLLMFTWRVTFEDRTGLLAGDSRPIIFGLWHNRLALSMTVYHDYVRRKFPSKGLAAMISASKDGGLLAKILDQFDVHPVRGSSSRRGRQALLEAARLAQKGFHVAITPDGPRGPRYQAHDGIIGLAQVTGYPIVPVSMSIKGKIRTKSWDRFMIPLPFARCHIILGKTIFVARDSSEEIKNNLRQKLEQGMSAYGDE